MKMLLACPVGHHANHLGLFALAFVVALPVAGLAQQEKLGKVTFRTSCDARVQGQFERGVSFHHERPSTGAKQP